MGVGSVSYTHLPNKAAFARAKRKTMEHMERVEKPQEDDAHIFTGEINPLLPGSKWVFTSEHLKIGYEKPLLEITMRIRRGQKIALLGPNGAGKTTFLKTIAGFLPSLEGSYSLGNQTTIGYFDQHSGAIQSEQTLSLIHILRRNVFLCMSFSCLPLTKSPISGIFSGSAFHLLLHSP